MEERLAELEAQSVTHYQSAQFEKAEAAYTALLTDTDSNTEPGLLARIFNNRGHARYLQVRFTEAEADYDEAVRLDRSLAVAYYNSGTVRYRMGDMEGAGRDFRRAVELEPENGEFREGLKSCG